MQFHLNGFQPGDPEIYEPAERYPEPGTSGPIPDEVDVLIVGCGPAGLTLATQLSHFPDIKSCIVDQRPGPLTRGQADGIACRTVEMFHTFGFSERLLKEAYWVNETTFWKPDDQQAENIVRSGRVQDVEDGLSEFPHVILNQARVHDFYLEVMRKAPAKVMPYYARRFVDLHARPVNAVDSSSHALTAKLERLDGSKEGIFETVKARFVVGCDGARSAVRKSIGHELHGDSANHAWGVMDVLAVTDFPDVRFKSLIQSANDGSIIIIPREGGYLVRFYIELKKLEAGERVSGRNITADDLIAKAQRILHPYSIEVKEVAWWSVYEIGQRLTDKFDDVPARAVDVRIPRVFIAGDACHTHSPKAGQGMNVSMQDSFNLGWKLAAVIRKRCAPQLLHTYSAERQAIAKELIDFDREWATLLASAHKKGSVDPVEIQRYFVQHGRYTAGTATRYQRSIITGESTYQNLATGFLIGMRFHSAPVIRLADAKPVDLGHCAQADGRWRLYIFCDPADSIGSSVNVRTLCEFLLEKRDSPIKKYTLGDEDIDSVFDVRAIFQEDYRKVAIDAMPRLLHPPKGRYRLRDYEKVFCANLRDNRDVFTMRGVNRAAGCIVVVRPDQYVSHILPLDAHRELGAFFDGFFLQEAVS